VPMPIDEDASRKNQSQWFTRERTAVARERITIDVPMCIDLLPSSSVLVTGHLLYSTLVKLLVLACSVYLYKSVVFCSLMAL